MRKRRPGPPWRVGQRVRAWKQLGESGHWYVGVVVGVDNRGRPGVAIARVPPLPFGHPEATYYAPHEEVENA